MVLNGCTYAQIMREQLPGRRTIKCWKAWLENKFLIHSHVLKARFSCLRKAQSIESFWLTCFKHMSLAKAMFYVQQDEEVIP